MPLTHRISTITFCCFLFGLFLWAWKHEMIVFRMPHNSRISSTNVCVSKKPTTLFYFSYGTWRSEIIDSLWGTDTAENLLYLINNWLTLLDEEKIMPHKVSLQSVILSPSTTEAFISFDRNPFGPEDSTYTKLMWIESLLKTIRGNTIPIQTVRLLTHHAPLPEPHLDTEVSWPLNGFLEEIAPIQTRTSYDESALISTPAKKLYTIMIDPAGDAQNAGRTLQDNYERGITLQSAQEIKKQLEALFPHVRVIFTRYAGEVIEPLQNANFANRLHADLYVSLNFYHDENSSPLFVYQYVKDPTDIWPKSISHTSFIPYEQIHLLASNSSYRLRQKFIDALQKSGQRIDLKNIACPFLPLKGISSPALGIEIGLHNKNDWQSHIKPLVTALSHIIQTGDE